MGVGVSQLASGWSTWRDLSSFSMSARTCESIIMVSLVFIKIRRRTNTTSSTFASFLQHGAISPCRPCFRFLDVSSNPYLCYRIRGRIVANVEGGSPLLLASL